MIETGTEMRKTREELNGRTCFRLSVKSFISELLFFNCLLDILAEIHRGHLDILGKRCDLEKRMLGP